MSNAAKYPGWRHMTGAQRRNARMDRIFDEARARGDWPGQNSWRIATMSTPDLHSIITSGDRVEFKRYIATCAPNGVTLAWIAAQRACVQDFAELAFAEMQRRDGQAAMKQRRKTAGPG